MGVKARFIKVVGTRGALRRYWGEDCPNCGGKGGKGYHNAEIPLGTVPELKAWGAFGKPEDYAPERWPTKCDHCPAVAPEDATRQVFTKQHYDTASGHPEPGDLFFGDWEHWDSPYTMRDGKPCQPTTCVHGWSNCDGRHLFAVLPNGDHWTIDGRASNCTMPDDQVHRCWVRRGNPETGELVHVDKAGHTCAAGAGSIATSGWHGFLHNGEWQGC